MLLYDGRELVVHYHEGTSDYVLVTFVGGWETRQALKSYFCKPVVEALSITCIGVTTKVDQYYVSDEAEKVRQVISSITSKFSNVIIVGASMGGHPAIAWSKALNANVVLSLAPKWSIDPGECAIQHPFFQDHMKGMGLREHQAQGRIFVAYDPKHAEDKSHAHLVQKHIPHVSLVPAFHAGHVIIWSLRGVKEFGRILEALAHGTDAEIVSAISEVRRKSSYVVIERARSSTLRHPLLNARSVLSCMSGSLREKKNIIEGKVIGRIIFNLIIRNNIEYPKSFYRELSSIFGLEVSGFGERFSFSDEFFTPFLYHGHVLICDFQKKCLSSRDVGFPGEQGCDVMGRRTSAGIVLCIENNWGLFYIGQKQGKFFLTPDSESENLLMLKKSGTENYYSCLTSTGYLTGQPDRRVSAGAGTVKDWEKICLMPRVVRLEAAGVVTQEKSSDAANDDVKVETVQQPPRKFWQIW